MPQPAPAYPTADTAADRIADFLAAHAKTGRSDELAIRDLRTPDGSYGVATLRAADLADVLAELAALRRDAS